MLIKSKILFQDIYIHIYFPEFFGRVLGHKWPLQSRHFSDEFRADLYVFEPGEQGEWAQIGG